MNRSTWRALAVATVVLAAVLGAWEAASPSRAARPPLARFLPEAVARIEVGDAVITRAPGGWRVAGETEAANAAAVERLLDDLRTARVTRRLSTGWREDSGTAVRLLGPRGEAILSLVIHGEAPEGGTIVARDGERFVVDSELWASVRGIGRGH